MPILALRKHVKVIYRNLVHHTPPLSRSSVSLTAFVRGVSVHHLLHHIHHHAVIGIQAQGYANKERALKYTLSLRKKEIRAVSVAERRPKPAGAVSQWRRV